MIRVSVPPSIPPTKSSTCSSDNCVLVSVEAIVPPAEIVTLVPAVKAATTLAVSVTSALASIPSSLVAWSSLITPQADVVAAGSDTLSPSDEFTVKDVPFAVAVKLVTTFVLFAVLATISSHLAALNTPATEVVACAKTISSEPPSDVIP